MNIKELKSYVKNFLNNNDIKEYKEFEINKIISFYLGIPYDRLNLLLNDINCDESLKNSIIEAIKKMYFDNIPLQYITHEQNFYKEKYYVDENVLIPRSDTEVLVETAIKYIDKFSLKNMVDMCTGSGCVGISVAINSSIEKVKLIDISSKALNVANKNIALNGAKRKCETLESNMFSNLNETEKYDIIASNPPYIKSNDINSLDKEVKKEPMLALDGGEDGLIFYKRLFEESKKYINNLGYLIFEIGYDELNDIIKLAKNYEYYDIIECIKDYAKNDRVVVCRFHQK